MEIRNDLEYANSQPNENELNKIYIENSKFMEYVGEIATRITEERFREETYEEKRFPNEQEYLAFTDEAQDFYNEVYDEYETLTNNILNLYCNNEINK